jgi:hypothetical protein
MVLNADSQYTVIGGDRGFVQIIRTHDLQPVYAYPQCDASIRTLAITHDQKYESEQKKIDSIVKKTLF